MREQTQEDPIADRRGIRDPYAHRGIRALASRQPEPGGGET